LDPAVALLVGACHLVLPRWEGHGVEQAREGHLPLVDAAYCGVGWASGGDV
jgi:hypothetical protein